jgi:hypothetical protein
MRGMVDFQSFSIMLAAITLVVAASYYALNLREIRRSRRITLTTTVLEPFMTIEGNRLVMDLMNMTWNDLDDYKNKYDHRANPENFALRMSVWNRCNTIGSLYREGLLDLKTLYVGSGRILIWLWLKSKPIIEMYRGTDFEEKSYEDWEYLAERLLEYTESQDEVSEGYYSDLMEKPGTIT